MVNQIEETVLIGGDSGQVLTYDLQSRELIDIWGVGQKITALASLSLEEGGFIIAAGTVSGSVFIRQDWEEIIPRYHSVSNRSINDLAFSPNGQLLAAACSDKFIYLFQLNDNDFVKLQGCKLESGFPVSLNFSKDSKKILVTTNLRKMLLLDPGSYTILTRVEDICQCFWEQWVGRYALVTKSQSS